MRRGLRAGARRSAAFRRVLEVSARELEAALRDDLYEHEYFGGVAHQPADMIGTDRFTRDSSHANEGAYLVWRWLPARRVLDVGCAFGFLVEALRELGIDAEGVDVSKFALDHAATGARGHVRYGNLLHGLPIPDRAFDVVCAFETLEHLPPPAVPGAVAELARCSSGYVVATIPSFGTNRNGPGGWFEVKVRPERLEHYKALGDGYDGPVPHEDLYRDEKGEPVEGHLTIASFNWWTARFADAGLVRCDAVERAVHPHLARFGLTKYWNLYVLRHPGVPEPVDLRRDPAEVAALERRWSLGTRPVDPEDVERVVAVLGEHAFDGIDLVLPAGETV